MIIDTHCHLDQLVPDVPYLQVDPNNVYITMGTSSDNWVQVIKLSLRYQNVIPAIGLHPWFVDNAYELQLKQLDHILKTTHVSVLGEVGLDFSAPYIANKTQQTSAFEQQLSLAHFHHLPLSLHVYKAHNAMLSLLKPYSVTGVIHGLGTSVQVAKQYLDLGFKFGVNGVVVKDNARRYHELVKTFGADSIVLETDYPNILLPNHAQPSLIDIYTVVTKIAELTGLLESEVIHITNRNASSIFNLRNRFEPII